VNRDVVLDTAKKYVMKDRQADHGAPEDTFARIAALWNAYLCPSGVAPDGWGLTPTDAAMMLALLKVARQRENPGHEDNYVDLAGYAACAAEIRAMTWHLQHPSGEEEA